MALTIHYRLHSPAATPADARRLVEQLRQRALDLPMVEVGEIIERTDAGCDYQNCGSDDPNLPFADR